ncbi:apolipoprotein N-acyltransferase [Allorhizocola rhizosphaerae]|uniref:apolipoprotein N-acyltransferase n=1 Tax=Allorhizocola rhizosphaerae TaxID=1872709 RepID=UPI001FE4B598|nr:apolipoprotein N-acyltransferase [Allorhizocola rhizosphaerae]
MLVAAGLAVLSGLALLFAFPPLGWWWLAPVGVALLAFAVKGRRLRAGFGLGMITGIVFFGPLLSWTNLHTGYVPWLLLALFQATYYALLGMALSWALVESLRKWWPLIVALLWVAEEALRDRAPFGGFPWGRLAFSQGGSPVLDFAAYGGAPLVTFLVAVAGGLLFMLRWPYLVGAIGVMAVGLVVPVQTPGGAPVTVAIVQGNVPRMGLDFNEQRKAVLDNHVRNTVDLAGQVRRGEVKQPDLVVWPENASDIDPLVNADARAAIDAAAQAINAPILVGAVLRGPGENESRNAGIVWEPGNGPQEMYLKRHPVPFAEYMPMRSLIMPIARAITNQAKLLRTDFVAGTEPGVLAVGPTRVGDVICFEVAYDEVVRDVVTNGAELIAVQTNNATFNEAEAAQQLAMVRLRAVEHGRDSLMASTVGISAFVTSDGHVHDASQFNTPDVMVRELRTGDSTTLATRLGKWPEVALTLCAVLFLVLAAVRRRASLLLGDGIERGRLSRRGSGVGDHPDL